MPQKKDEGMCALTPDQTVELLKLFEGKYWHIMTLAAVSTGLRRGEALANLDGGWISAHSLISLAG